MLRNRTACVKSNHVDHFQKGNIGHTEYLYGINIITIFIIIIISLLYVLICNGTKYKHNLYKTKL